MNLTIDQYDRIEAYLNGQLAAADQQAFEAEVAQNDELRVEVATQRDLRLGFRAAGIEQALLAAQQRHQQKQPQPNVQETGRVLPFAGATRQVTWRHWAAAASVVVLLGAGWLTWQQQRSVNDLTNAVAMAERDLSDTSFKRMPLDSLVLTRKTTLSPATKQRLDWYIALAYVRSGKTAEARASLTRIGQTKGHPYQVRANQLLKQLP